MNMKKMFVPVLVLGIIMVLIQTIPSIAYKKQDETEPIYIPKQVKAELEKGIENRRPRLDIPFEIFENLYLPARQNLHSIFLFRAQNSDLGFVPFSQASEAGSEKKEESQETVEESNLLLADLNAFLWFHQLNGDQNKEVYVPVKIQVEKDDYDPEEEFMYSVGYPLPPGKYLLAMAVTSKDLQKIGTQYFEFELPAPESFTDNLGTSPVFFVREIEKMDSAETITKIHKEFFTYSVLKIKPVLQNVFTQGDSLDVFFYIFGAQPNPETNKYNLNAYYELIQDGEVIVCYAEGSYEAPIISQPLRLQKTVLIQKKKGDEVIEEKKETKDIEPGDYTFVIYLKDNISGKKLEKKVDISVEDSKK